MKYAGQNVYRGKGKATQRDYIRLRKKEIRFIAQLLKRNKTKDWKRIVEVFANELQISNLYYDKEEFLVQCGYFEE